jgi:hypothetical protein
MKVVEADTGNDAVTGWQTIPVWIHWTYRCTANHLKFTTVYSTCSWWIAEEKINGFHRFNEK